LYGIVFYQNVYTQNTFSFRDAHSALDLVTALK
jgi:hypothetical protein